MHLGQRALCGVLQPGRVCPWLCAVMLPPELGLTFRTGFGSKAVTQIVESGWLGLRHGLCKWQLNKHTRKLHPQYQQLSNKREIGLLLPGCSTLSFRQEWRNRRGFASNGGQGLPGTCAQKLHVPHDWDSQEAYSYPGSPNNCGYGMKVL